jgi:hypothetical protein
MRGECERREERGEGRKRQGERCDGTFYEKKKNAA